MFVARRPLAFVLPVSFPLFSRPPHVASSSWSAASRRLVVPVCLLGFRLHLAHLPLAVARTRACCPQAALFDLQYLTRPWCHVAFHWQLPVSHRNVSHLCPVHSPHVFIRRPWLEQYIHVQCRQEHSVIVWLVECQLLHHLGRSLLSRARPRQTRFPQRVEQPALDCLGVLSELPGGFTIFVFEQSSFGVGGVADLYRAFVLVRPPLFILLPSVLGVPHSLLVLLVRLILCPLACWRYHLVPFVKYHYIEFHCSLLSRDL